MKVDTFTDQTVEDSFDFTIEVSDSSPVEVVETIDEMVMGGPMPIARCN